MFIFDIFTQAEPDGTLGATLAGVIEDIPHAPSRIRDLGIFRTGSLLGTVAAYDVTAWGVDLVQTSNRSDDTTYVESDDRNMVDFRAVHLSKSAKITEEDFRDIRALGKAQFEAAKGLLARKARKPVLDVRTTIEWHMLGAIRGLILNANGDVITDMFAKLGQTNRGTRYLDIANLADGEFNTICGEIVDTVADSLGGLSFSSVHAFVNNATMRSIANLPECREAFRFQQSSQLRENKGYGTVFEYGGITFETYRGKVGGVDFVSEGEIIAFPLGADNFVQDFAPANRIGEEYQIGQPEFVIPFEDPRGKFEEVEIQANPLTLNLRPHATVICNIGAEPVVPEE